MWGLKFRRQCPLEGYIVDFYCSCLNIAIELDGSHHGDEVQSLYDKERDRFLKRKGIKIIRIWNDQVIQQEDMTYEYLKNLLRRTLSQSLPLEGREEAF